MSRVNDELEAMTRLNKRAWEETYRLSDAYVCQKGEIFDSIDETKVQESIEHIKNKPSQDRSVKIVNADPLEIAQILCEKNTVPLVVNAGSQNDPMKIVENGASGPEWDLFRRSNLCNAIDVDQMYPLYEGRALYFPDVTVFRNEKYDKIKPFKIAIMTINPISRPGLIQTQNQGKIVEKYQSISDANRMRMRIDRMFELALIKKHKCLIINDFGCDPILENPVQEIIGFFNDALKKYPVKYVFFGIQQSKIDKIKNASKSKHRSKNKSRGTDSSECKNYILFHKGIDRAVTVTK